MTKQIERRLSTLEAIPAPLSAADEASWQEGMARKAQRCGYTPEQVEKHFGGWPGFAYALMKGVIVDPAYPPQPAAHLPPGVSPMEAYMSMIKRRR